MTDEARMADDGCTNEPGELRQIARNVLAVRAAQMMGEPTVVDNDDGTFTHTWSAKERKPMEPDDVAEIWGK